MGFDFWKAGRWMINPVGEAAKWAYGAYKRDIESGQLNPAIPSYDYEPYRRLKQETIGAAAGRASQAARGTAAAMEGRGTARIPGASADITQRYNTALQGQVGQQMASIDTQAAQHKMQYDQWRSGFEAQIAQYNEALKQGKKQLWIEGLATLLGAGMKIAGAGMGGGAGAGMSAAGGGVAGAGSAAGSLPSTQFQAPTSFTPAKLPFSGLSQYGTQPQQVMDPQQLEEQQYQYQYRLPSMGNPYRNPSRFGD